MKQDYVYSYSDAEDRGMIDTRVHAGFESRSKPVAASSWIEAKKLLGFELTALQQRMLGAS